MEHENTYGKGLAGTALGLGAGALGAQLLSGGLGNLFGNNASRCSEDHTINRYEAGLNGRIAELDTKVKLLEADIYTDQKVADAYERLGNRIGAVEASINHQAVVNAQITANIGCMQASIAALQSLTKTVIPIENICPTPATTASTT